MSTDHRSSSDIAAKHGSSTVGSDSASKLIPYAKITNGTLVRFADVDYLSDPHRGRSESGYVFTIGNTVIYWRSTKQILVTADILSK